MRLINPRHAWGALLHSLDGLRRAWREQAFRHEALLLPVVCLLLWLLRPGLAWSAALIAAWLLVMIVELLNSAIEEAFDRITTEYDLRVKHGKDMASAAILLTLVLNVLLWLAMFADCFLS